MKIALFDYLVDDSNAIGRFNRLLVEGLGREHQFTLYAANCELAEGVPARWVKVPILGRSPLLLLFIVYRCMAAVRYLWDRTVRDPRFDLRQSVESITGFGDLVHAHFCHRYFLRHEWQNAVRGQRNLRTLARGWDHRLRAACEPAAYRRARWIVVPSLGLQRELEAEYPWVRGRVRLIHNPVAAARLSPPSGFARMAGRQTLGVDAGGVLFCFAALGHFERKGLPLLLEAVRQLQGEGGSTGGRNWSVLVVGGRPNLVAAYRQKCAALGVDRWFHFVGMQPDIRRFLWMSDAFLLTSYYEVFPTVALEAAAAGLPLLSTPLNGVEEFLRDGENGFLMPRDVAGIAGVMRRFLALTPLQRQALGVCARNSIGAYSEENFLGAWRKLYAEVEKHGLPFQTGAFPAGAV